MRILISGAGIAGPTLAYWLSRYGHEPTLIEQASSLRSGGYIIDFWGAGYDIAERMGLLPEITKKGYRVREVREVGVSGERVAGFSVDSFIHLTHGRYVSIARGDLAASIFSALNGKVETIFGNAVLRLEQSTKSVRVEFERGNPREFDLVVGADGLHSKIRELVFGPEEQFEKYLGFKVAAFELKGYKHRDELAYVTHTVVGQQVGRFALRDDRTMFLFCFADDNPVISESNDLAGQKALLKKRFGKVGWECPTILEALDSVDHLYFDRVSQIRMNSREALWSKDRVTLIGDAASCVSLLAGQGSALAMIAAFILAGELKRSQGDYRLAFSRYQGLFGPFVAKKQKGAEWFAGAFAPQSALGLRVRNRVFDALKVKWIANLVVGRGLTDLIELPNYDD